MSVISFKARVSLISEEEVDAMLLGEPSDQKPYVCWRKTTMRSSEIKQIVQFDKEKCFVYTYEFDRILVKEPHASLHKRWKEAVAQEKPDDEVEDFNEMHGNPEEGDDDEENNED